LRSQAFGACGLVKVRAAEQAHSQEIALAAEGGTQVAQSMFFFAYDGSINGDWVSHYAIRLASHYPDRSLQLIHIRDGQMPASDLDRKLERIRLECGRLGVSLNARLESVKRNVGDSIQSLVPGGRDHYLICGTRVLESRRGFLSGTISEQLLHAGRCHVLALRVVQPGLLGSPESFLLPVSGHPRGFRSGIPFLSLFAPDVLAIHILFVERITPWRFRLLSHEAAERLRQRGLTYIQRIERQIGQHFTPGRPVVDANVVVSDDVPKEIVIFANKVRSQLIYMGASERNLPARFFYGNPIEQVLRDTVCDVAVYRGVE